MIDYKMSFLAEVDWHVYLYKIDFGSDHNGTKENIIYTEYNIALKPLLNEWFRENVLSCDAIQNRMAKSFYLISTLLFI